MKKIILLAILITTNAFAIDPSPTTGFYDPNINCNECGESSSFINLFSDVKSAAYNVKDFDSYITDTCSTENSSYEYGHCKDGTTSFVQPDSEGYFKQEGLCGQTAISNFYNMYCGRNIKVKDVDRYYANDITPGLSTSSLSGGANNLFSESRDCPSGVFQPYYASNGDDFINSVLGSVMQNTGSSNQVVRKDSRQRNVKRSPVAILVSVPGKKVLHWITVVDVEFHDGECMMILNQWSDQYTMPCESVADLSKKAGDEYWALGISPYTMIEFNRD